MKIPFRWRLHWFLMGWASIFGIRQTPEQIAREVEQCVREITKENQ